MYVETSSGISGADIIFCRFERTGNVQITKITFYYNRFLSSDPNLRAVGSFGFQLLLSDKKWRTRYNIPKNDR